MAAFFFFNDTATTEIYTLSLHDALPILDPSQTKVEMLRINRDVELTDWLTSDARAETAQPPPATMVGFGASDAGEPVGQLHVRSEEHTSELQSHFNLVCRLLLSKQTYPS